MNDRDGTVFESFPNASFGFQFRFLFILNFLPISIFREVRVIGISVEVLPEGGLIPFAQEEGVSTPSFMSLAAHAQKDSKVPPVNFHQEKVFSSLAEVTFSFRETHLSITILLQISRLIQLKAMLRRHTKLKIAVTFQMERRGWRRKQTVSFCSRYRAKQKCICHVGRTRDRRERTGKIRTYICILLF